MLNGICAKTLCTPNCYVMCRYTRKSNWIHNPCPHVISRRLSDSDNAGTSGTWFLQTLGAVPLFTCACGWECDHVWFCNHIKPNGFTFIRVWWMLPSCLDFSEYQSISVCVRIAVYVLVPTHAHRRALLFLDFSTAGCHIVEDNIQVTWTWQSAFGTEVHLIFNFKLLLMSPKIRQWYLLEDHQHIENEEDDICINVSLENMQHLRAPQSSFL